MIKKGHTPQRMCVICRSRFEKNSLNRFFLSHFKEDYKGCRSFYICKECFLLDENIIKKRIFKILKVNIDNKSLKETF